MNDPAAPLSDEALDAPLPPALEEALQRLVQLNAGDATPADHAAYAAWRQSSPPRQQAALLAEQLWQGLKPAPKPRRRRTLGVGLGVLLALGSLLGWQGQTQGWYADQRTAVAERRSLTLDDGSRLILGPQTRVDILIEQDRRRLRLYRGELFVQVAADPARPFEVEAAGGHMRALGTAFDVRRDGEQVRLAVTEHSVRTQVAAQRLDIREGQAVDFDPHGLQAPFNQSAETTLAWTRGRLVFDNRALGDVVAELSRYTPGLLLITDERLKRLPVTGVFSTEDVQAQLSLMARTLPLSVTRWPGVTLIGTR